MHVQATSQTSTTGTTLDNVDSRVCLRCSGRLSRYDSYDMCQACCLTADINTVEDPRPVPRGAYVAMVEGLTYGELQVALYAADIPEKGHIKLPAEKIAKVAAQGLERLGYERVQELTTLHSKINAQRVRKLVAHGDNADTSAENSEFAQHWSSERRMQKCVDMAFAYMFRTQKPVTNR